MKLNENFLIHDTGNGEILIAVGEETKKFHGIVKLNSTGAEIVHLIEQNDLSVEEICEHFYEKCPNDDKETIKKGVSDFINQLEKINAIKL
ncbi:MAG: PqqD family protein [Bacilli bacterium]|nr:PqqD family protein [Bacilli bacterium]